VGKDVNIGIPWEKYSSLAAIQKLGGGIGRMGWEKKCAEGTKVKNKWTK